MKRQMIFVIMILSTVILIGVFVYLNYQTHFSIAAKKGKFNVENIKKVKKGMSVNDVLSIMGKPDILDCCDGVDCVLNGYNYNTNDESYAYVKICFDSTMKVRETYFPKK